MPIYEYICDGCGHKFEQLRPLSKADNTADCPKCQKAIKPKMSTFACFSVTAAGIPKTIPGTSGSSCSSCSSGDCSTCAS